MIARFLDWIGLGRKPRKPSNRVRSARPTSATAHLFEKKPPSQGQSSAKVAADDDFNPYNTGKFDRSASWERISKNQR